MPKGENTSLYFPESPPSGVSLEEVSAWAAREHSKIAAVLEAALARQVEFLQAEPVRLREGMIRGADGTNWNPGAGGQGVYAYYNNTWNKLG